MRQAKDIHLVGIAGAGTMGSSMAQIFAKYGKKVLIYDVSEASVERGRNLINVNQQTQVDTGDATEEQAQAVKDNISFTLDLNDFKDVDYIVECVFESMEVKHDFWSKASRIVPEDIVIASNTSGLSITEISKAVYHPERFVGMHWVAPPHLVPLVEVIAGDESSTEATDIAYELALDIKRKPVRVLKDVNGFILNRLQYAVLRESCYIAENGIASMEDVDNVMKYGLGMRYAAIGPFETVDLGGLDIFFKVGSYMFASLCNDQKVPDCIVERYNEGAYGVKSGKGFFDYPGDAAKEKIMKRDKDLLKLSKLIEE